jgi:hypothetical protein
LQLERDLEIHRHSVSTTDPVFPNLIYMLQAFAVFRSEVHGESCVVRITAPATSQPLASVFAQLSVATSNCATFGPDAPLNTNPDLESEAMNGMMPDAIVFHAAHDDRAANELFMRLYNQIKLVRSYKMPNATDYQSPPGGYAHTVWLQFGSQVKWNSEVVLPLPQIPEGWRSVTPEIERASSKKRQLRSEGQGRSASAPTTRPGRALRHRSMGRSWRTTRTSL